MAFVCLARGPLSIRQKKQLRICTLPRRVAFDVRFIVASFIPLASARTERFFSSARSLTDSFLPEARTG